MQEETGFIQAIEMNPADITASKLTLAISGKEQSVGYKLSPESKPKAIDLLERIGDRDRPIPGIYALEGGDLKLCWDTNARSRPKDFTGKSAPGQDLRLLVLKRVRKR